MNLNNIAKQLKEIPNIALIYAFNATGKTRLSVAYKNVTKEQNEGEHAGVYYNAFSEDLFVWDNDEENDNANIKLLIKHSSLNQFHSLVTDNLLDEKLEFYQPKYKYTLNNYEDLEKGIESISFYVDEEKELPIKISRGEERIFVWCFFLALFEVDGFADQQNSHIFIDDPVSSLDEHNVFVTVDSIFDLIEKNYTTKKIILTTHHIGLFSILSDRLTSGEKSRRYKNITNLFILSNNDKQLVLNKPNNNVFLYHLHLMQILDQAIKKELFAYHFVLLRQLLENISSYLGKSNFSYTLSKIGIKDTEKIANVINELSHKNAYRLQSSKMTPAEEEIFKDIFDKLQTKYEFSF